MGVKRDAEVHILARDRLTIKLIFLIRILLLVLHHPGLRVIGHLHSVPLRESPPVVLRVEAAICTVPGVAIVGDAVCPVAGFLCVEVVGLAYDFALYAHAQGYP